MVRAQGGILAQSSPRHEHTNCHVDTKVGSALAAFRGGMPSVSFDARRIAGGLEQPGCSRRQLLDAVAAPLDRIAGLLGCAEAGQSPFAISRGIAFENKVFENQIERLAALMRSHFGHEIGELTEVDLSAKEVRKALGRADNQLRVVETLKHLTQLLSTQKASGHLLRHAMFRMKAGNFDAYLEADAVCFFVGGQLHVAEIKSFPAIDGVADPEKVAAALLQTAVYVAALQDTVSSLGYDASLVSTRVLLVLPENFTLTPTGFVRDIAPVLRRLRRRLRGLPTSSILTRAIPADVSLPGLPAAGADPEVRDRAVMELSMAISAVDCRFGDGCGSCPLFQYCRDEARRLGAVATAGSAAAEICGDVQSIDTALRLAEAKQLPSTAAESAVAAQLGRAAAVHTRLLTSATNRDSYEV
jgi:hypothetical protein